MSFKTIEWKDNGVIILDQRKLPHEEIYLRYEDYHGIVQAIKDMVIRGAPAIGVAAAFGIALGIIKMEEMPWERFYEAFEHICDQFSNTRPTAINLFWAIQRMKKIVVQNKGMALDELKALVEKEAMKIFEEDIGINKAIGHNGKDLIKDGDHILTHCNAGALATAGYGTALGIIRAAYHQGKKIRVFVDETRPFLQGARLTAWELNKEGIPVTLICDNMAAYFMKKKEIDLIITGADRIAVNGDTANKIGTYCLALLAKEHGIPFYVAAPTSTIDLNTKTGNEIPIEERDEREVAYLGGKRIAPRGIEIRNPAFDVTPSSYITAIITEVGVFSPPYSFSTVLSSPL